MGSLDLYKFAAEGGAPRGGRGEDGAWHNVRLGLGNGEMESLSSASRFCTGSTGFRAGISGGDAVPQSPGLRGDLATWISPECPPAVCAADGKAHLSWPK